MIASGERMVPGESAPLVEKEHLERYRFVASVGLVAGSAVADIACGSGYGAKMLAESGARSVLGVDISSETVEFATIQHGSEAARFQVGSAEDLSFIPSGSLDVVVSFETIEHVTGSDQMLDEFWRIIKPGGHLFVSTPDRRIASVMFAITRRPQNPHHVREFTGQELCKALRRRFEIESLYGQAFLSRWLVAWPVQVLIKAGCRIANREGIFKWRDDVFSNQGNVEVVAATERVSMIPKYWVVHCRRP